MCLVEVKVHLKNLFYHVVLRFIISVNLILFYINMAFLQWLQVQIPIVFYLVEGQHKSEYDTF